MGTWILVPTGHASSLGSPLGSRVETLQGKTVGFLNNGWACMEIILRRFDEVLRRDYKVAGTRTREIPVSNEAPPAVVAEVAAASDLVIVGLGN